MGLKPHNVSGWGFSETSGGVKKRAVKKSDPLTHCFICHQSLAGAETIWIKQTTLIEINGPSIHKELKTPILEYMVHVNCFERTI
jgi:hypothetical protein